MKFISRSSNNLGALIIFELRDGSAFNVLSQISPEKMPLAHKVFAGFVMAIIIVHCCLHVKKHKRQNAEFNSKIS